VIFVKTDNGAMGCNAQGVIFLVQQRTLELQFGDGNERQNELAIARQRRLALNCLTMMQPQWPGARKNLQRIEQKQNLNEIVQLCFGKICNLV
jgi:hypothetical protein